MIDRRSFLAAALAAFFINLSFVSAGAASVAVRDLTVSWDKEILTIHGKHLPGGMLQVWYLEAFCRPGSTGRDWTQTVIPHKTELVSTGEGGRWISFGPV